MNSHTVFLRRLGVVCAPVVLVVAFSSLGLAQTEFTSQDSAKTMLHSGIVTKTGVVWDTALTKMVTAAIGATNYNEIGFAFMECFGGGMIDELLAANLKNAAYTSAARHDEVSWAFPPGLIVTPATAPKAESTYNLPYAPAAGSATAFTLQQAAVVGRNNDATGPVTNSGTTLFPNGLVFPGLNGAKVYPVLEHPQYTSSGAVGDSDTLHRVNPNNAVANTNYLAVAFGGSKNEIGNTNSLARITTALTQRGYVAAEEKIIAPGGSAKDMQSLWDFVKANTNATTQIYFWSNWGHGVRGRDVNGTIKQIALGGVPISGTTYAFTMDSDLISDMTAHFNLAQGINDANPQDSPYFELQTEHLITNVHVTLNGHALTSFGTFDLFEDGSEFDYRFGLTAGDMTLLGLNNTISYTWDGPADPLFDLGILTTGDISNFDFGAPEPGSIVLVLMGAVSLGGSRMFRSRRRGLRRGKPLESDAVAA